MYPSVYKRLPNWSEQIDQLIQRDKIFYEICADYQELSDWLETYAEQISTPASVTAANQELLGELEVELLDFLQETMPEKSIQNEAVKTNVG